MDSSTLKREIAVIIAVYNREKYLAQAINSIINQDLPKHIYSVLIVDDGSVDNTPSILDSYQRFDNIVLIKNKKNKGLTFSLNRALSLVQSKFFIRFDSDDIASPDLLSELYKNIEGHTFCHPFMYVFYNENLEKKFLYEVSSLPSFFGSGVLFRYDAMPKYKYSELFWEEFDLYLKILEDKHKYKILPKPLFYHRVHSQNITGTEEMFIKGYFQLQKKWGREVLEKYDLTLEKISKFYGYYLEK